MSSGYRGHFVIACADTETDGLVGAPPASIAIGSIWRWRGLALRVDGPAGLLLLDAPDDAARSSATLAAQRILRAHMPQVLGAQGLRSAPRAGADDMPLTRGFTVTDGHGSFRIGIVEARGRDALLLVDGPLPPQDCDLHVTECTSGAPAAEAAGGMVCFTPGTRIDTPDGPRAVEAIRAGDWLMTRDNGAQQVIWTGSRRLSGARLHALPALRPIRLRAHALGPERPEGDLLVSPDHRLLVSGPRARALFGEDEVLVAARDLIDDGSIVTATGLREVTYVHLLTERHELIRANGLFAETFHPDAADPDALAAPDRAALAEVLPGAGYGDPVRRPLTRPEAAILLRGGA